MRPSPPYGQWYSSPPKPVLPPPRKKRKKERTPAMAYMTPPTTPDTPSLSYSPTSPASLASPPAPLGNKDSFKVGEIDHSGYLTFTVNHFNSPVTYSSESFVRVPIKRMPALCEDGVVEEQDRKEELEEAPNPSSGPTPCAAGVTLDTLFETLSDT